MEYILYIKLYLIIIFYKLIFFNFPFKLNIWLNLKNGNNEKNIRKSTLKTWSQIVIYLKPVFLLEKVKKIVMLCK